MRFIQSLFLASALIVSLSSCDFLNFLKSTGIEGTENIPNVGQKCSGCGSTNTIEQNGVTVCADCGVQVQIPVNGN
jgi:rRNA maturation endonuclease Nob1